MSLFGAAILLFSLQQVTDAQLENETKVENATRKITVTTVSNYFDAENKLNQVENTTRTVGTVEEALALMTAGLNENDGGISVMMIGNSTQVVDNKVARQVLEKTFTDFANRPGAPVEIFTVEAWVCQTAFQPTSCIHGTITTNPPT